MSRKAADLVQKGAVGEYPDVHQQEHIGNVAEIKHVVVPPAARRVPSQLTCRLQGVSRWCQAAGSRIECHAATTSRPATAGRQPALLDAVKPLPISVQSISPAVHAAAGCHTGLSPACCHYAAGTPECSGTLRAQCQDLAPASSMLCQPMQDIKGTYFFMRYMTQRSVNSTAASMV